MIPLIMVAHSTANKYVVNGVGPTIIMSAALQLGHGCFVLEFIADSKIYTSEQSAS